MIASKAATLFSVNTFLFTCSQAITEVSWDDDGLVCHLYQVTLCPERQGLTPPPQPPPPPQSHGQRVCILGPGSVTMKWDGVVNRYKCQFLSSHLSTSGFFLIYQQVCDVLSLAVCTLRSFNSAFYVHMLFTFFHGVSWQRIKYIYFKGVWELLLHVHLQLKRRRTQFHF